MMVNLPSITLSSHNRPTRKGQPYYTRCGAAHRTRGRWVVGYNRVDPCGQPWEGRAGDAAHRTRG